MRLMPASRDEIAGLLPHGGAMVLLDRVLDWDAAGIACAAVSHLDPGNPLRRAGRLSVLCGLEFALQAAALHGALTGGGAQPAGYVATLRDAAFAPGRLDDPAHGVLRVTARLERQEAGGLIYALAVAAAGGAVLAGGRAVIALPAQACG